MMEQGVSQSALAAKLGMTQPRISQFFSPSCNLTIKNLARIFHALDDQCSIWSPRLEQLAEEGKIPSSPAFQIMPRLRVCETRAVYASWSALQTRQGDGDYVMDVSAIDEWTAVTPQSGPARFELAVPDSRPASTQELVS
jgi:transcriptional regulator with XRE-family HTH domain